MLELFPDVFADIINVLVYQGEPVVREEKLIDRSGVYVYQSEEQRIRQKERDVLMVDSGGEQAYVLYGLENQMKINQVMPVRVMGYDFASYDREISRLKGENRSAGREADYAMELHQEQKLMPVLTLVLYFGMKPWTGPRSLRDVLSIPDALDSFMPDYSISPPPNRRHAFRDAKCAARLSRDGWSIGSRRMKVYAINVIQVADLPLETIEKFTSDFQIAARWFRDKRLGNVEELMQGEMFGNHESGNMENKS